MAEAVHHNHSRTARYTATNVGSTWETTDTVAAATLTTAGFAANDEVIVIVYAMIASLNPAGGKMPMFRILYDGNDIGPTTGTFQYQVNPGSANVEIAHMWMERVDLGATVGAFETQLRTAFSTQDQYLERMEILILRAEDLGTENTDWHWNQSNDTTAADFPTTWGSKASVTFTPGSVEDWVVIGAIHANADSFTNSYECRLALDGSAIAGSFLEEPEHGNEQRRHLLFDVIPSLSAASHTVAWQNQAGTTGTAAHSRSSILVFKKSTFADIYIDEAGTVAVATGTDVQVATITDTLSATQDIWIMGQGNLNADSTNVDAWLWVRQDGTTVIEPAVDQTSGLSAAKTFDATDEKQLNWAGYIADESGALDLDLFAHHNEGNSRNLLVTKFLVWGMELAGAQTISPALVSQLATASAPQLNMEMTPALTSQTLTTFAPQANLGMAPALVTQTATAFDPTLTTGPVQIDPALVSQLVAAFAPAFTVTVAPALVSQTLTVFDPSQLWRSIDPALVTQLATPFDPTVSVSGGTQQIDPTLVSQLATASAPQVNLAIAPALVSQLVAASDPQLNLAVAPGLVSQLLTSFDPSQLSRTIDPALVTQLAAASDPSLSIQVAPGLVTQTLTAFAPTFAITVAPALVTQLVAASDPTFTITIDPVLVSQLLAASDPTVSLSTGQQIDPALVTQLITAFAFVIMGHARYIEGAGAASRIEAGTVVSGIREGRISATGRIG